MTREMRWLRRELTIVTTAIANEKRYAVMRRRGQLLDRDMPQHEHDHMRRRRDVLRRIITIVERAQRC